MHCFCYELNCAPPLKNSYFDALVSNVIVFGGSAFRVQFSSVQFSCSVVSDSLWPHESQHARPPCPSPTPGVHSDSRPSSRWCHPAISSSAIPFSSCPQSLPTSESFPMSQFFAWGGRSTGVHQGCILSPCLFNLYAEYIMKNPRLDEAQAGIKISGRNTNSLRYADDTTLMAES